MYDGGTSVTGSHFFIFQTSWFPANYAIFARFAQDEIPKPSDAVHIIPTKNAIKLNQCLATKSTCEYHELKNQENAPSENQTDADSC